MINERRYETMNIVKEAIIIATINAVRDIVIAKITCGSN